jgi:hypothetical protein
MELKVAIKVDLSNPDIGDLFLDDNGLEVLEQDLGVEVAQRITVRFNFFLGEWFLDASEGTPWFQRVLVKAPSDRVVRTVLTQVITGTEGVASIVSLAYDIGKDRLLSVRFVAQLVDGSTFRSTDYAPFQVDLVGVE